MRARASARHAHTHTHTHTRTRTRKRTHACCRFVALLMELADVGSLRGLLDADAPSVLHHPATQLGIALNIATGMVRTGIGSALPCLLY